MTKVRNYQSEEKNISQSLKYLAMLCVKALHYLAAFLNAFILTENREKKSSLGQPEDFPCVFALSHWT